MATQPGTKPLRGRPPKTNRDAIIAAGIQVGLNNLKIKAVASHLGVTPTALYHHVADLPTLRLLVGDEIASTISLPTEADGPIDYLVQLGMILRDAEVRHPGIGLFFATSGRECESTKRLLTDGVGQMITFGLAPQDAFMVCGVVTNTAIGFASHERGLAEHESDLPGDPLLRWVLTNLATSLVSNLGSAPWNCS